MWPRTREPAEAEREVCEGVASPPRGHGLSSAVREKRGGQETANPRRSFESSLGVPAFLFCRARWVGHPPSTPSAVVRSAHGRLSRGPSRRGLCGEGFPPAPGPPSVKVKKGAQGVARGGVTPEGVATWRTLTGEWLESKNVRPDADMKADGVARQEEMEAPRARGSQRNRRKRIK